MIAERSGKHVSSVERELKSMESEGLLESRRMRVRYSSDKVAHAKVYKWV